MKNKIKTKKSFDFCKKQKGNTKHTKHTNPNILQLYKIFI